MQVWINTNQTLRSYEINFQTTFFLYIPYILCFDYNENGQLIAQHQWKVPSKEENARNGLPETDWRDAQYDMLYLPVTETVRYHYDFNGNRTATVLPDGRQINYLYYGSGHLHQISLDDEVITDIERDKLHREIYRTQGKLASRYELDPLGRLKRQIATLNDLTEGRKGKTKVAAGFSQTAVKRSYGYDRTGNLTHSTDQRTGTTQFEYDKLGRITQAGNELFAFDPAHNILDIPTEKIKPYPAPSPVGEGRGEGKTTAPLSDDRSAITDNRLKTYNGTTYYYDELGNLIHRELADGEVQNYFYDLHDQLVKAEIFKKDGSKETWAYTYDALGRRIGKGRLKTSQEVSDDLENQTRFAWDGSHLLQEVHPDGRYTYIYADQDSYEPLAQVRDWTTEDDENRQQTHYFHCDQIGIPREMTDKDGNLLWFGNYTGWGRLKEETRVTDTAYQPFRLQNQYADRETGLHYNFFRYYEPDVGRFVNQDPIGLMGGMNLYQFAPNTQQWIDHLGLDVNIIRSDRSVTFILDISLNGRNVTNTDIENVKNGIERNWNAGGWKYGGCNIRFIANVKANDSKMANQITAEPINGRSYVNKAGGNRGVWYMRDPNVSWVAAHEAGHLMGLGDRYKDINGKSIPQKGWENNIMAAPNKPVEQRNINELIPFTTKCACNILEYM